MVNGCYMCKKSVESCNHNLLQCPMAYELWIIVYILLGINWVMVGLVEMNYGLGEVYAKKTICKSYSTYYLLGFMERKNSRAFEGNEGEISKVRIRWFHFFESLILGQEIRG